ncbi:MAG TPA: CPBP family intramembrane metalloprotease [Anaerohalosphaeraceae bacterium]|nr:CPBP family intramembrane metalloprotease [Anaerohalosphaeraceae bacterium]
MKALLVLLLAAQAGFFVLFRPWTKDIPFWPVMTVMTAVLGGGALALDWQMLKAVFRFDCSAVILGVGSAIILYGLFWLGYWISSAVLPFAASQVQSVYAVRAGQNPWIITGLLCLIIAPAEEIFWRGFVLHRLSRQFGFAAGLAAAAAVYALVHIWSFNLMLSAAAGICGVYWALLFFLTQNLWSCIISHCLWDVMIFVLFPIQ